MQKLKVLISAYSVCPNRGSEPGMGWNWISSLARVCELFIITESDWKTRIEKELSNHPFQNNMHFYYIAQDSSAISKGENQGDWRFYYYYRKWQLQAFKLARKILKEQKIDVVHQLNMIGFREPGYLWKISSHPFVWGPIGGMENIPLSYFISAGIKQFTFCALKNIINRLQTIFQYRVRKSIQRANAVISAVPGVQLLIKKYHRRDSYLMPETGCGMHMLTQEKKFESSFFDILWVGKFDFRKQLNIAIDVMRHLKDFPDIRLHVCGTGGFVQTRHYKEMAQKYGVSNNVIWHGQLTLEEVARVRLNCDLFLFTSVMDATSTVLLEAVQSSLPVICFDTCGMSAIVDDRIGTKIPLSNPEKSAGDFAKSILHLYHDRELLRAKSNNCAEVAHGHSWESKANKMVSIYQNAIKSYKDSHK